MTVKELRELLDKCRPDAEVHLYLNASMVDREPKEQDDGIEYSFDPVVSVSWGSRGCNGPADYLNIEMSQPTRSA